MYFELYFQGGEESYLEIYITGAASALSPHSAVLLTPLLLQLEVKGPLTYNLQLVVLQHQHFFYRFNLMFRIVMGYGAANVG